MIRAESGRLYGSTPDDDDAWQKFKRKVATMKPGAWIRVEWSTPRSGPQHRKMWSLLRLIVDNSETYNSVERALVAVKIAAGFFDPHVDPITGEVQKVPQSIKYESMEQGDFNHFFEQAVTATCTHIVPQFDTETAYALMDQVLAGWG